MLGRVDASITLLSLNGRLLRLFVEFVRYTQHGIPSENVLPGLGASIGVDGAVDGIELPQKVVGGEAQQQTVVQQSARE